MSLKNKWNGALWFLSSLSVWGSATWLLLSRIVGTCRKTLILTEKGPNGAPVCLQLFSDELIAAYLSRGLLISNSIWCRRTKEIDRLNRMRVAVCGFHFYQAVLPLYTSSVWWKSLLCVCTARHCTTKWNHHACKPWVARNSSFTCPWRC